MVEGGASVIGSFLAAASSPQGTKNGAQRSIVDTVIVTVAPTFVGDDGIGYGIGLGREQVGQSMERGIVLLNIYFFALVLDSQTAAYSN
jgi:riboflavin biosynthesis pyrimidine reductase